MKESCKSVKAYKGTRPPKCCGGEGCKECWKIYLMAAKARKK